MHASQFPQLRFPELDYTRAAVAVLNQRNGPQQISAPLASHSRVSLHRLPRRTFEDWVEHMCALLNASGQLDFSNLLSAQLGSSRTMMFPIDKREGGETRSAARKFHLRSRTISEWPPVRTLRRLTKNWLHRLELKYGYFLPYTISASCADELYHKIHDICREDDVRTILVVGANPKQRCTQAVLAGARENMRAPHVYCFASKSFEALPNDAIEWLQFSSEGGDRIASSVAQILRDGSIESFDVVVVDASEWPVLQPSHRVYRRYERYVSMPE